MATEISDAVKAVIEAVKALEVAEEASVAVTVEPSVDTVRKAVEDILTEEGWTAPEAETPTEDAAPEAVAADAEAVA